MKLYTYVGPDSIRATARFDTPRHAVVDAAELLSWVSAHLGFSRRDHQITLTYVVRPPNLLFVADRHSEHVACARGEMVLTAGEITFERHGSDLRLLDTSNLSTGYCPESISWPALSSALVAAGFPKIEGFTQPFEFRYCIPCQQTCVIKDDVFECPSCFTNLPHDWNYPKSE